MAEAGEPIEPWMMDEVKKYIEGAFLEATVSKPSLVTHEVEKILGRPAETFAEGVAAHRALFTN